jgi:uncharacterized spore protein YtfJ
MMDSAQSFRATAEKNREHIAALIERIYGATRPGAVFGEPITSGGYTVITAQEISSGGGFGTGMGFGPRRARLPARIPLAVVAAWVAVAAR